MEFIQNTGPATRLDQLNNAAVQEAESVIAVGAYISDSPLAGRAHRTTRPGDPQAT